MRPSAETSPDALSLRQRVWLLASQAINAFFFAGDVAEPLSVRAWRERRDPTWSKRRARIDRFLGENHCMNAYLAHALREMHRAASGRKPQESSTP